MNKSYDPKAAKRLVPLLVSITAEIFERQAAIRELETRLSDVAAEDRGNRSSLDVQAELAHHRRELRHAREELADLGCVQDELEPTQVRIPGQDGALDNGYSWQVGEETISLIEPDASTA